MVQALGRWGVGPREYALLIVNELPDNLALSARNVERLEVNAASALRVYDVLRADKIIIETSALRYIQVCSGYCVGIASTVKQSINEQVPCQWLPLQPTRGRDSSLVAQQTSFGPTVILDSSDFCECIVYLCAMSIFDMHLFPNRAVLSPL